MASSRTELSATAKAALLTLLAEGRRLTNAEMEEAANVRLTGEARRRLNDDKLVESTKAGRSFEHEITDDGVAWCREQLTAAAPPRSGALGGALYALLRGLGRTGIPLAELFPDRGDERDVEEPVGSAEASVADRIREAYRAAAFADGEFVHLARLRERLADLDRAEVDAALERLAAVNGVFLDAEPDPGSLTAEEKEAAVRVGGEDRHMIMIEAR